MTADQIGRLAEVVTAVHLARPVGRPFHRPLFRATHLGDKYPAVDLLVDLVDRRDTALGFFFVQVKGTTTADPGQTRLPVDVAPERFNQLVRLPAPTFLVGVDVRTESAFVVAASRTRKVRVSSISKDFSLGDDAVKMTLYREVLAYGAANRRLRRNTGFQDV